MIDIHTHILYGVDDGAKNLEMSLELIEEAEKFGFSKIIFTSHYMEQYFTVDAQKRQKILTQIDNTKMSNVDLYIGNEVFLTNNIMNLLHEKKIVTLAGSKYVLFELPFNTKPMNFMKMVFQMQSNDLIPVLAHPERYSYFYKTPKIYEELVDKGVLLQVNFGSFGGQYGKRAKLMAEKLLKNNLVHFLATDVHRPNTLYPAIPKLLKRLNELVGKEKVYQLTTTNPELVIENKDIEVEKYTPIKWSFFEKMKINRK